MRETDGSGLLRERARVCEELDAEVRTYETGRIGLRYKAQGRMVLEELEGLRSRRGDREDPAPSFSD